MLRTDELLEKDLIPLDKSWMMRVGVLDIIHGYSDIIFFLEEQFELSDDLVALLRSAKAWNVDDIVDVGESGTLYRFLLFASWKLGLEREFLRHGSLRERKINNDRSIINMSLENLLKLDNGTTQWASAAILLGNEETLENVPYKVALTYDALQHWIEKRAEGSPWLPQHDATIQTQAEALIRVLRGEDITKFYAPAHSEDYCFARAFELLAPQEGEKQWPSLRGHESDRIEEMEKALKLLIEQNSITSKDHRIVTALAMLAKSKGQVPTIESPEAVNKSWPQFWRFLEEVGV